MKKKLIAYIRQMEQLLKENKPISKEQIENHVIQIGLFQQERLLHLLVTIFVGLVAILFLLFGLMLESSGLISIFLCLLLLFCPYLLHYYLLENGVQKLYQQYDLLLKK